VEGIVGGDTLEKLYATRHLGVVPALRSNDPDIARQCIAEELAKLVARRGAAREVEEALTDIGAVADEALTWRLRQAAQALERAGKSQSEDKREFNVAPNGVRLDRDEVSAFDRLLSQIGFDGGSDEK